MLTLSLISVATRLSLANDGRCVRKFFALGCPDPALIAVLVVPVIESPVAVILITLPPLTSSRKRLYGMVTEAGWLADWIDAADNDIEQEQADDEHPEASQRIGLYPSVFGP